MGSTTFHASYWVNGVGQSEQNVRINYTESYNPATNKTTVTYSYGEIASNFTLGNQVVRGKVQFNGTDVKTYPTNTAAYTCSVPGGVNNYGTISGGSGGSVTVSHNAAGQASITIKLVALEGSYFGVAYNGNMYGAIGTNTVNLTTHTSTLTVNPNGGTWNGSTASQTFTQAPTTTKSIANPTRTGYTFTGWTITGGGSMSGSTYTFGSSNGTLTAQWQVNSYSVSVAAGTDIASVSGGGTYDYGSSVTVDAVLGSIPGYTYAFDGWYDSNDTKVSSSLSYTFTMGTSAVSLTAKATKTANSYTLSLTAGEYIDSVSGGGTKTFGDSVTVEAVLDVQSGYTITFDGWYNGGTKVSSSQSYTFTYNTAGDLSLTAKATRTINSYVLTLTKGDYIASVSGGGTKVYDSSVTAVAVLGSASGYAYSFDGWYDGATKVSSSLSYTFNMPASALSLTAKGARSIIPYALSINAGTGTTITVNRTSSPNAGAATGAITAADPIYYGDILAVAFSTTAGYDLLTRTINGNSVAATVNYTVTGATAIAATAEPHEYALALNISNSGVTASVLRLSSPIGGGSVGQIFNGATLYYGDELLVSYDFGLGYQVDAHTINGVDFDSGDTYTVVGDTTVVVTASASGFVYIRNKAYLAYVGSADGTEWKRYQAQVGDGSNWIAH